MTDPQKQTMPLTEAQLVELRIKMVGGFARHEHTLAEMFSVFDHIAWLTVELAKARSRVEYLENLIGKRPRP